MHLPNSSIRVILQALTCYQDEIQAVIRAHFDTGAWEYSPASRDVYHDACKKLLMVQNEIRRLENAESRSRSALAPSRD